MKSYITQVPSDDPNNLTTDQSFYERFAFKSLADATSNISSVYNLNFNLVSNYFPWNRTFEIGLVGGFGRERK